MMQECERVAALNGADPRGKFSVVRFLHAFYFDEHLCMVLELLDCTLLEYMVGVLRLEFGSLVLCDP